MRCHLLRANRYRRTPLIPWLTGLRFVTLRLCSGKRVGLVLTGGNINEALFRQALAL